MTQPLAFDIIARDRASANTARIGKGFSNLGATTRGVFAGMGAAVGIFAVRQLGNAARAVKDFAVDSIREFANFDRSMREVWTLLPDLSAGAFKSLQKDVLDFTTEMGIAHEEAVPALYQAISAGIPQENVFDFLTTAAKFSIGGVTNLQTAVDGLTSVTNAYGREVLSAQEASDIFFTTVRLGKTNAAELSASLFQVIPTAASLGISFQTVGAALAAITTQGVPTSVATTQLRQLFVELNKEGGKTASTFEDLSGKSFADFVRDGGSVRGALALMKQEADENNTSLSNLFGSVEAGNAALALTSESGAAAFKNALGEMQTSAGATDTAFEKMEGGIGTSWDKLQTRVELFKLEIGEKLAPVVEDVLGWLNDIATKNAEVGESFKVFGDVAGEQLSGRIAPELEAFAASFSETLSDNENDLKELTRHAGTVTAATIQQFRVMKDVTIQQVRFMSDVTIQQLRTVGNVMLGFAEVVAGAGVAAFGWVPGLGDQFREAEERTREFRNNVNDFLDGIQSRKTINVVTRFSTTGPPPPGFQGGRIEFMQHGGQVFGPPGLDRVAAQLTAGEFVVRREMAQRNLPLLQALNAGAGSSGPAQVGISVRGDGTLFGRAVAEAVRSNLHNNTSFRRDVAAVVSRGR